MSNVVEKDALPDRQRPAVPIRWQSWPAREAATGTLAVVLGLLGVGLVAWWLTGRTILAVLAAGALAASLWRFFLPVVFEMNENGVDQRILGRLRHIPWNEIGAYEIGPDGVLLLPGKEHHPLEPWHGLYVPWMTHRDEVLAHLNHHLQQPAR